MLFDDPSRSAETARPSQPTETARPSQTTGLIARTGPIEKPAGTTGPTPVAQLLTPLLETLFGETIPVPVRFWDGSEAGPPRGPGRLLVQSPQALRRLMWAPGDLGLGRSYLEGGIAFEGDIFAMLRALQDAVPQRDARLGARAARTTLVAAHRVGALGLPLPPPPEEMRRPHGRRHSKRRDARAIGYHYDVGNEFYRLVLGPTLTYSCGRFVSDQSSLEDAQASKHELVCAKLGLPQRPGARLLDIGCGWGSMAMHAATHHGASVVGVTISEAQAELARKRVADAGLADRVEIRLQDYRDVRGEQFDAISSIGMFEHVGSERTKQYFDNARALLQPGGRLLNHAISSPGGAKMGGRSFIGRYVFPDGELLDVGDVVLAMERAGFEVRDVESLREHYARTLRAWVANLNAGWDQAVAVVGIRRARIWQLYMAASAVGFDDGGVAIHQVLGAVPDAHGRSSMPAMRSWT